MQLTVLLFAGLRQRVGASEITVEIDAPATVGDLRRKLAKERPEIGPQLLHCRVAVDQEFADDSAELGENREIALIPPVSGGHDGPSPGQSSGQDLPQRGSHSQLTDAPLSLAEVIAQVEHRDAGGVATFTGNIREHSRGKQVEHLEYEAYPAMAVAKMDEIARAVEAEVEGARVALAHRVGRLEIGEAAVVIAASAPHRAEAFAACREVIERLKRDVPIWKKEVDTEGAEWIGQGP